jgi:tRNA dimethylallyltransferase
MVKHISKSAVLIAGPTASGKSALALRLARERGGVIINADALQVYGELRILTARPTEVEERLAPHRLYGHVSGGESYSVGQWLVDATGEVEKCWAAGQLPIITGGTGLYFKALEQGLADVPAIAAELRAHWRAFEGDLHAELARRDAEGAGLLQPNDRQRLIRALEVIEGTGQPLRHWQRQARQPLAGVVVERHFVDVPRDELYTRAEARFDAMMKTGALDEARAIMHRDPGLPMMKAIAIPELTAHLRGEIDFDTAIALCKTATRNYIKRQLTWWRGQMKHWPREAAP